MTSNLTDWFNHHLDTSGAAFVWAVEQVPAERRQREPAAELGEWSAARHLFHMLFYEREMVLPTMRLWLGEAFDPAGAPDEDVAWDSQATVADMLDQFRQGRVEQLELLRSLPEAAWSETNETAWGEVTLKWLVTKTFQHTAEHTHHVLTLALFWEVVPAQPRLH